VHHAGENDPPLPQERFSSPPQLCLCAKFVRAGENENSVRVVCVYPQEAFQKAVRAFDRMDTPEEQNYLVLWPDAERIE
jgi:hypothetical protein